MRSAAAARLPRDRPVQRGLRLLGGLVLFGLALAVLVRAGLGLDPWDVFNQGVAHRAGVSIGTVTVAGSALLLLTFKPLHQRVGLGTVANALVVGPVLDAGLRVVPAAHQAPWQWAYLVAAICGVAVATGLYVGAGWGPGPRDGVMTGLAARGMPLFAARAAIEVTVLVVGWALGGSVGIATVVFALAIGPLVGWCLPRLAVPAPAEAR